MPDHRSPVIVKLTDADAKALIVERKAKVAAELAAHVATRRKDRAAPIDLGKATGDLATADAAKAVQVASFDTAVDAVLVKAEVTRADFAAVHHDHSTGCLICRREADPVGDGIPRINGLVCVERHRVKLDDKQADDHAAAYGLYLAAGYDAADLGRQVAEYEAAHPAARDAGLIGGPAFADPAHDALVEARDAARKAGRDQMEIMAGIEEAALAAAGVKLPENVLFHSICQSWSGEIVISWPDAPEPKVNEAPKGGAEEVVP